MKTKAQLRDDGVTPSTNGSSARHCRVAPASPPAEGGHLRAWMHEGLCDLPRASAVLALGCDEIFLAADLAVYSADVTVLDVSGRPCLQQARRYPEIDFLAHKPGQPLPFVHDTFDAIWCSEFLDRVLDPTAVLREMHRVLAPGGRLLLTVPDHGTMRNVLIALFKWDEHFSPSNPRVRHFTRTTLEKLVRAAGFENLEVSTGGAVRRIAGRLVPRTLLLRARKPIASALIPPAARTRDAEETELRSVETLAFASRTGAR
jgi:SAM-dependent methyltransferase